MSICLRTCKQISSRNVISCLYNVATISHNNANKCYYYYYYCNTRCETKFVFNKVFDFNKPLSQMENISTETNKSIKIKYQILDENKLIIKFYIKKINDLWVNYCI